jgi:hypothetical protein
MYLSLVQKTALLREVKDHEIDSYFLVNKLEPNSSKEVLAKLRLKLPKDDYLVVLVRK